MTDGCLSAFGYMIRSDWRRVISACPSEDGALAGACVHSETVHCKKKKNPRFCLFSDLGMDSYIARLPQELYQLGEVGCCAISLLRNN